MIALLRSELGRYWLLWLALYGMVCLAGATALLLLFLAFCLNETL